MQGEASPLALPGIHPTTTLGYVGDEGSWSIMVGVSPAREVPNWTIVLVLRAVHPHSNTNQMAPRLGQISHHQQLGGK